MDVYERNEGTTDSIRNLHASLLSVKRIIAPLHSSNINKTYPTFVQLSDTVQLFFLEPQSDSRFQSVFDNMLFDIAERFINGFKVCWERIPQPPAVLLVRLSVFCAIWLMWRLWTFTILPLSRPREPKELPYWIPGEYINANISAPYSQILKLLQYLVRVHFQEDTHAILTPHSGHAGSFFKNSHKLIAYGVYVSIIQRLVLFRSQQQSML